jgi:hypothetical protein
LSEDAAAHAVQLNDRFVEVGHRLQLARFSVGEFELVLQHQERRQGAGLEAALFAEEHARCRFARGAT